MNRERVGQNEARFRAVNERIEQGRDREDDTTLVGFVCECAHPDCARIIEMTVPEYEAVRRDARTFAVVAGHELPDSEDVVERHERYVVVRKLGAAADAARKRDPRR